MKKRICIAVVLLAILVFSASAQTSDAKQTVCPEIKIIGPPTVLNAGEIMRFRLETGEAKNLNFDWTISEGRIIEGAGTNKIGVETFEPGGQVIAAKVTVGGLPKECVNIFTETGVVSAKLEPHPLEQFEKLADDDVKVRVDNLIITLQNDPGSTGYFVSVGPPAEVAHVQNVIRNHIDFRGYDPYRIILIYKEYETKIQTKIWVVPPGADISEII